MLSVLARVVRSFTTKHWATQSLWTTPPANSNSDLLNERTTLACTDNMAGLWWQRKGSVTCTSDPAHLLRLQAMHQRFDRYVLRVNFFIRVNNLISDRPSYLADPTDNQLLTYLETHFPQPLPWRLWTPSPKLASGIASALRKKTSARDCLLEEPPPPMATGPSGPISAQGWPSTPYPSLIKTLSPSSTPFAQDYRTGNIAPYSRGVRSRTVEDAVRLIGQAIVMLGSKDPRMTSTGKLDGRLQLQFRCYSQQDPPPSRVKPILVQVLCRIAFVGAASRDPELQAVADMIIIAFFFLLRPWEYTGTKSDSSPF